MHPRPIILYRHRQTGLGQSTLHAGHIALMSSEAVWKVWQPFPSFDPDFSSMVG